MANIRIYRRTNERALIRINGQDYSAEAFEATSHAELGITKDEAAKVAAKIAEFEPE